MYVVILETSSYTYSDAVSGEKFLFGMWFLFF